MAQLALDDVRPRALGGELEDSRRNGGAEVCVVGRVRSAEHQWLAGRKIDHLVPARKSLAHLPAASCERGTLTVSYAGDATHDIAKVNQRLKLARR